MKNVLITGAAGFLGSHLTKRHLDAGDNVLGVDNFVSSRPDSQHMKDLSRSARFKFLKHDICDDEYMLTMSLPKKIDLVYNMACPASPPIYQAHPVSTMMTCTVGVKKMLDLARRHGAVFVQASTSEVYGDPTCSPQSEKYRGNVNPYGPRSCYDEGKRAAEALCYDYRAKFGVDARLVRIFNTYGPHMDPNDGRVISNFVCQALRGELLTVYGDGLQTRSFCYVDDLVEGIIRLGALGANPGTPVNIGNPDEYTVKELATRIATKFNVGIIHRDLPVDDPTQRRPDTTLAKQLLGWVPQVGLDQGLSMTVDYFRSVNG